VYAGSIVALQPTYGPGIWALGVLAGVLHSLESSALDYFNREYLYFGYGKVDGDYWNPSDEEARREAAAATGLDGFMQRSRLTWIWQQNRLSTRSAAQRERWRSLARNPAFQELYREHNRAFLPWWRLMGPNFHTLMILVFTFLRRFDLYLILVDIAFLPVALVVLRIRQARIDGRFAEALRAKGLA
jgi:hypothetical protein